MKATIDLDFKRIGRAKANQKLLDKQPKLLKATEVTLQKLCDNLEKYFREKNIKVKAKYKIEKWS